jgi:hypothetical protein
MPESALRVLQDLCLERQELDYRIRVHVLEARVKGLTWEVIGEALGVTRQAAQQRYG